MTRMKAAPFPPLPEDGDLVELNELLEGDWAGGRPSASEAPEAWTSHNECGVPGGPSSSGRRANLNSEDAEQGDDVGTAPPSRTRATWILSRTVWEYLSRLEFYEGDASLPGRTRLFHHW